MSKVRKDLERELIKQVSEWTGRKGYPHELVIAWFQLKQFSDEEVLAALVNINQMLYTRNRFLQR